MAILDLKDFIDDADKWLTLVLALNRAGITERDPIKLAELVQRGRGTWHMDGRTDRYDAGLPDDTEADE